MRMIGVAVAAAAAAVVACAQDSDMNTLGERYVRLVLAMGQHDADYVDAYYGSPEWRTEVDALKIPLAEITSRAAALTEEIATAAPPAGADELTRLRHDYLARQLEALRARAAMLSGTRLSFDEESQALYDAVAPTHTEAEFAGVLAALEAKLPGKGPLVDRYDEFRKQFVIAPDRLDAVFKAAIDGCRSRTLQHIQLPPGESFTVEYVTGKSWSGYNWYQGNYRSLIQVNTDLPIYIDRAIDLACHEGYPAITSTTCCSRRTSFAIAGGGVLRLPPLFAAVADRGRHRQFRDRGGIPTDRSPRVRAPGPFPGSATEVRNGDGVLRRAGAGGPLVVRRQRGGAPVFERTDRRARGRDWLERYGLYSRPRAEQRVRFVDQYRSYVINYNLGKDMVAAHVEGRAAHRTIRRSGGTNSRSSSRHHVCRPG